MQLKLITTLFLTLCAFTITMAQNNASDRLSLSNIVYSPIRNLLIERYENDTTKNIEFDHTGYLFVKFQIINSKIDSIKFMEFGNKIFKDITKDALINIPKDALKNIVVSKDEKFVLPILYDFASSGWLPVEEKLKRMPNLLSMPGSVGMEKDFMSFLSLDNLETNAVKVFLLKPLRVSRPIYD